MSNFLVINLSYFGDVLLTNALCQNIKLEYPESKVIFAVDKPFYEAAKYMKDVDDVLAFDKRGEHKGLLGLLKFVTNCKYKFKIDTAFIMYGNDRGILLSFFLGVKKRISATPKITRRLLTHQDLDFENYHQTQDTNASFLKTLTNKSITPLPIKYLPAKEAISFAENLFSEFGITTDDEVIGICATSKRIEKDIPVKDCVDLINHLTKNNKKVLFTGAGKRSVDYITQIQELGCNNFIDLVNKTTISQLASVIKKCDKFISVDTGTMHLTCAIETPLLALFYDPSCIERWAPKEFYNHKLLKENITVENILETLAEI
ncbi:MAG: glycosyltransferase family 9 protein [bacterium]